MNSIFDLQLNTKSHASPFAGSIILFIRSPLEYLIIALYDFGLPGSFKTSVVTYYFGQTKTICASIVKKGNWHDEHELVRIICLTDQASKVSVG
jgi:hypothetical protein